MFKGTTKNQNMQEETELFPLTKVKNKAVTLDFESPDVSSVGGLALLKEDKSSMSFIHEIAQQAQSPQTAKCRGILLLASNRRNPDSSSKVTCMSDRIEEISEDLEADFGKPYNVSEDNSHYMLSLIKENMIDGIINPDLQEPSLDAMATTTMAIYKYPNIPWRELSQKPAIKRGLTFIACNVSNHPEKVEDMFHRLIQKHYGGLTVKMCQAVLKIVKLMISYVNVYITLN